MTIPKVVHQIAPKDKSKWHPFWIKCHESWLKSFSNFECIIWNDREDINNFVYNNYPEFANVYNSFPVHIMRIDFVRLCILHKHGGIYADMDYFVYKNFYNELKKDIGFLENLTEEYTSAPFENSLMYSSPGNQLLYELMKYTKTCFIHHRNMFKKNDNNWRSIDNDKIINNTTGSGMISEGVKFFKKYFDIDSLSCRTFNNRPASYDDTFFGKHVHSSLWGNEYCEHQPTHLFIKNGMMYNLFGDNVENIKCLKPPYDLLKIEDFNFFKDYTNGMFLKENNLQEIKNYLSVSHYDT